MRGQVCRQDALQQPCDRRVRTDPALLARETTAALREVLPQIASPPPPPLNRIDTLIFTQNVEFPAYRAAIHGGGTVGFTALDSLPPSLPPYPLQEEERPISIPTPSSASLPFPSPPPPKKPLYFEQLSISRKSKIPATIKA